MRIGVFGGSFDPVHIGHLLAAECCREQAGLDRVLFVPTAIQPHKQQRQTTAGQHRLEMLALATGGHDAFAVSGDELERGGVSYTVDTLEQLKARHPGDELLLILGPDAFLSLPTWREPRRIIDLAEILAVRGQRTGVLTAGLACPVGPQPPSRRPARRRRALDSRDRRAGEAAGNRHSRQRPPGRGGGRNKHPLPHPSRSRTLHRHPPTLPVTRPGLVPALVFPELVDQAFDQICPHSKHPPVTDDGRFDVLQFHGPLRSRLAERV